MWSVRLEHPLRLREVRVAAREWAPLNSSLRLPGHLHPGDVPPLQAGHHQGVGAPQVQPRLAPPPHVPRVVEEKYMKEFLLVFILS